MKQVLGGFMGLGLGLGLLRFIRLNLKTPLESRSLRKTETYSLIFLFGPLLIFNLKKILVERIRSGGLSSNLFGYSTYNWAFLFACILVVLLAWMICRMRKGKLPIAPSSDLGQAQLLAFVLSIILVLIYVVYPQIHAVKVLVILVSLLITYLVIFQISEQPDLIERESTPADSKVWLPGWIFLVIFILIQMLVLGMAKYTVSLKLESFG